jgi:hypothetical protein
VKLARLTSGSGSSSWRTPNSQLIEAKPHGTKLFGRTPADPQVGLADQVANWPTVCASEVRQGFQDRSRGMKGSQESLTTAVVKDAANWPTPQANEIENPNKVYRSPTNAYRGNKKVQPMLADVCKHGQAAPANWPTPMQMDHWMSNNPRTDGRQEQLPNAVAKHGQAAPASSSSLGSRQGLWPTARSLDGSVNESLETWTARYHRKEAEGINLHRPLPIAVMQEQAKSEEFLTPRTTDWKSTANAPSNPQRVEDGTATLGEFVHAKQWATPRSGKTTDENPETWALRQAKGNVATMPLGAQVKAWATPQAKDHKSGHRDPTIVQYKQLNVEVEARATGKLNPRWVETLMGLPIGWTMPSCTSPQTIAPMSSDSSAMGLCLPPQSGRSEFSLAS